MKWCTYSNLAGLAVLLLTFGSAPSAFPGQAAQAPAAPKSQDTNCINVDSLKEQVDESLRSMNLESKLANLSEVLAREEAVMSSPELAKLKSLSAQLEGKEGDIEAKAQEMAQEMSQRAEALASDAQEKGMDAGPKIWVADDGGGWLGVEIDEVTPEKAKDLKLSAVRGVIVQDVEPDSPAAKAGLKENDVVLQYDGQTVEGTVQFRRLVRETPAGRTIPLVVSRDGSTQNLSVELGDRNAYYEKNMRGKMQDFAKPFAFATPNFDLNFSGPGAFSMIDARTPILGISAEDLSGQLGSYFGAPNGAGVLVREVRNGTPAEKAGLKAGDVIVKVDGKAVANLSDLRDQLRNKSDQKSVSLGVLRNHSEMSVPVEIEKPKPLEKVQPTHRAQL